MKIRWLMAICLLVTMVAAFSCAPKEQAGPKLKVPPGYERLILVGSSLGGISSTGMIAYAKILTEYFPEVEWAARSGAQAVNTIQINEGKMKLGVLGASSYVDTYGKAKIPQSRLRGISIPGGELQHFFLVAKDKPWTDIAQLPKGLTINAGAPGAMNPKQTEMWLQIAGLDPKDYKLVPLSKSAATEAWRDKKVDVIFTNYGIHLWDLASSPQGIKPIGFTEEQVKKARPLFEDIGMWVEPGRLPEFAPDIFTKDVMSLIDLTYFGARDDFPEEMAYKMAKIFDEKYDEVKTFLSIREGTPKMLIKYSRPPVDMHPGVAKYYREKGYIK